MYSFDDSTKSLNLKGCGLISPKAVLIFPDNFVSFRSDTIEKYGVINLCSYIYLPTPPLGQDMA